MMTVAYNKQNPFLASIKERYVLSKPGSKKNTQHLVLNLRGSGLTYEVGDSIGVFPRHATDLINKTLQAAKATGQEHIQLKQTGELISFVGFLSTKGNITDVSQKLLKEVLARQTNADKKHELEQLLEEGNREALKAYLACHEVWDFLLAHVEVNFTPQELADLLMPLLPRFYSISSSQRYVGEEVHLTIAPLEYESNGHKRRGVCTHYLCELVELGDPTVPVFIQPSHGFKLPDDLQAPMLMIGPGTGIAPFRAFLQERLLHRRAKGRHWLFFGEWNRAYDFFYEEDWRTFEQYGHLRLDAAFSRDQAEKVYVQHKIFEHGEEFFRWLEEGAYLYVCGDAQRMAKDVEAAIQAVIQEYGKIDAQAARDYIKCLRQQKRYLRDVY
ncbi:Sulfite reductase [NADPH] flavoprotein alpha-component [Candidatus Protochlamydia naegleriophila]|uniref:assimilatory sulfite reductase (NADPH) n=1 Tax=Candidatus Protochlamydia naegleriophila TaxID=389348 RepID=A0A0U5K186_9BACT|nr:sulfite reductase [Candidatus Protochlamydia naegleriophila]CUI15867.1 Sulfite reductase [NADPH] flavoprotein alpha-component [Candidatus Protochlamydia naegleriophila]